MQTPSPQSVQERIETLSQRRQTHWLLIPRVPLSQAWERAERVDRLTRELADLYEELRRLRAGKS